MQPRPSKGNENRLPTQDSENEKEDIEKKVNFILGCLLFAPHLWQSNNYQETVPKYLFLEGNKKDDKILLSKKCFIDFSFSWDLSDYGY